MDRNKGAFKESVDEEMRDLNAPASEEKPDALNHHKGSAYLTGVRLHALTAGLCLGIFLVNFEISIVSTSLVSITDDLQHFSQSSWVVTAYLLTYTSFMIILARVSDLVGRKTILILSMFVFTIFSGGCAAAQTMVQLIVCRAFQGLGGSGVYSLVMIILFEMVPPAKWPLYSVIVTSLFGLSMVLGPIFGGLINLHSSWIWVFLLNVPGGLLTMAILGFALPNGFPYHGSPAKRPRPSASQIDFLGALLLLVAMTLHITGLEQAANLYSWKSAMVLAPLIIAAFLWVGFFVWQWYGASAGLRHDGIFPWRFCQNRVFMGLIANTFLNGAISTTCIVQIPVRHQAAGGASPLQAGIRLIPLSLTIQFGAMLVAVLAQKRRMPPVYLAFFGATGQVIGIIFMSRGSIEHPNWRALYGLEALTGLCVGIGIGVVTLMAPYATEKRDHAVATASIVQFRFLGGATALAITTAVSNTWLRSTLPKVLGPQSVALVFRATDVINTFPGWLQEIVRGIFVKSFNLQMRILIGFAAAEFLVSPLMWKKEQIMLD